MTQQEKQLQEEIILLKKREQIIKELAVKNGFFNYYFKNLTNYNTNLECFNAVNDLYYSFFGEYRYSSYDSFKNQINKYLKNS